MLCAAIIMAVSLVAVPSSQAIGGQHYPNGAEDFVVGILPPPGTYLVNYLAFVKKDTLTDNNGDDVPVSFDATALVEVPRFIWVTPHEIFGASYAAHIFLPFYAADVDISAGGSKIVDDDSRGLGDIIVSPLVLGWHFSPQFHMVAALDIYVPTGNYDENEPSTQILSRNHWTFEPVVAMTYLAGNFDFSIKLMYDFNTDNDDYINPATGEKDTLSPGQEFHFDYAVGYMTENFEFGLNGYYYKQVTDDEIDGTKLDDNRCQVAGLGPAVKWWPGKGRFSATLKHFQEFEAKNVPEGHSTWLKIAYAF